MENDRLIEIEKLLKEKREKQKEIENKINIEINNKVNFYSDLILKRIKHLYFTFLWDLLKYNNDEYIFKNKENDLIYDIYRVKLDFKRLADTQYDYLETINFKDTIHDTDIIIVLKEKIFDDRYYQYYPKYNLKYLKIDYRSHSMTRVEALETILRMMDTIDLNNTYEYLEAKQIDFLDSLKKEM